MQRAQSVRQLSHLRGRGERGALRPLTLAPSYGSGEIGAARRVCGSLRGSPRGGPWQG